VNKGNLVSKTQIPPHYGAIIILETYIAFIHTQNTDNTKHKTGTLFKEMVQFKMSQGVNAFK
jgi:hypothetical protein